MSTVSNDKLLELIESIKVNVGKREAKGGTDIEIHHKLLAQVNQLLLEVETPWNTVYRIGHQVR